MEDSIKRFFPEIELSLGLCYNLNNKSGELPAKAAPCFSFYDILSGTACVVQLRSQTVQSRQPALPQRPFERNT